MITVTAESRDEYVDLTRRNQVTPCTTLDRLLPEQDEETAAWNVEVANRFADELRRVTLAARGLLSTIVEFDGKDRRAGGPLDGPRPPKSASASSPSNPQRPPRGAGHSSA
ncbi:hypothetical protein [Streptomyces sp. NPDC059010]|uniref:hypothetical protein n=1 Tax=Streptomyces sp. NPDC059010 TaxID=3346695 RepID=UPI003674461D